MAGWSGLPQILKHQPRLHDILQEQRIDGCADGLTASSPRTALESQRQRRSSTVAAMLMLPLRAEGKI